MTPFRSEIYIPGLLEDMSRITGWATDTSGLKMSSYPHTFPKWLAVTPYVQAAIQELEGLTEKKAIGMMLNIVPPGVTSNTHTDEDVGAERYHLPIVTNQDSFWWDEVGGETKMQVGNWYGPIRHTKRHYVSNAGLTDRAHLVVDVR